MDTETGAGRSGWYPDPSGRYEHRFHNGVDWTADVADGGSRFVDPGGLLTPAGPVPESLGRNRLATVALVFGIIGVATAWIPFVFVVGAVASVIGLVGGGVALRRSRSSGAGRDRAVIALVTGTLGLGAAVVGGILTSVLNDALDRFEDPGPNEVAVATCDFDGAAWTAAGSITNLDDETRSYTLTLEFVRAGTDNAQVRTRVAVDDVAPGAAGAFEVRRALDLADVDCLVTDVDGPAPFGFDLDG